MPRLQTFIGDVHGKYAPYKKIIKEHANTIQVGDMGIGFVKQRSYSDVKYLSNPPHALMKEAGARFIRGNHDNPEVCKKHSQFIPDGVVEEDVMFIGGASSIDRAWRTKDYDWWEDEQVSNQDFEKLVEVYNDVKPKIMVTHECPEYIASAMLRHFNKEKFALHSETRWFFDRMWNAHAPKLWVFGHWHFSFDAVICETRFVCLNELEFKTFDLDKPLD